MKTIAIEWIIVALLALLAAIRRKRIRLLTPILVTAGVTFFALLTPAGKILLYVYSFPITEGALIEGLHKSAILIGMVFLSQLFVSRRIKLPGKAGAFLKQMFSDFDSLTSKRLSFKKGQIIASLDQRLNEVCPLTADASDKMETNDGK